MVPLLKMRCFSCLLRLSLPPETVADPWGCNRCVCNGQIKPMPFQECPQCPMPAILIVRFGFQICDSKLFDYLIKCEKCHARQNDDQPNETI